MADELIQIPSYLTQNSDVSDSSSQIMATASCTTFCEVYNECCGSEDCQATSESGCTSGCENNCQTTCETSCMNCEGIACQTTQSSSAELKITNTYINTVFAEVINLDTAFAYKRRFEWYVGNTYKITNYANVGASKSPNTTITGLSPSTTYVISVKIYNDDLNTYLTTLSKEVTTKNLPQLTSPTLNTDATVKTATSIKVTVNSVNGADTYYARINGGSTRTSSSGTFEFIGLSPNTQYFIEVKCSGEGYTDSNWGGYYATTLIGLPWEWMYPKTGLDLRPHVNEWLAFCNKINQVRIANGLSPITFTTSSTYIATDKPFYAWIWLQAANAINEINGQVSANCLNVKSWSESQGDDSIIYPWYFENLKIALNNAIV